MRRARLALVLGLAVIVGCSRAPAPLPEVPLPSPTPAPPIVFPRDFGSHDALTEWWYYTGHLTAADGHAYGFEFVIFQVQREGAPTGYLAHFAVSDIDRQQFVHEARFASTSQPFGGFPLEVNGWTLAASDGIQASLASGYALRVQMQDEKPPALHHGGYIDYGPAGGSYYYSRTRLRVMGSLNDTAVDGIAWMDHQWGNFVVTAAGGWDWYSLQLDDDTELMLYVLRSTSGETTGVYGTRVDATGEVSEVVSVSSVATGSWTSPHTGATYPSGWRLTLPDASVLTLEPQLRDQELWFPDAPGLAMPYWEGAVRVSGAESGVGYVELTGYAHP